METLFISDSNKLNTKFYVISDQGTVDYLMDVVYYHCSDYLSYDSWNTSSPFDADSQLAPKPQEAIQYYRASSTVLTLDGYNNSATFSSNESVSDSPLPQNIDTTLLECLNQTIGSAVPLIDPETWLSQHWWVGATIGICVAFSPILVVVLVVATGGPLLALFFVMRWVTNLVARIFAWLYSKVQGRASSFVMSGMTPMDTIHGTTGPQVNDWSSVEE